MKIHIHKSYGDSPGYGILHASLSGLLPGRGVALTADDGEADCVVYVGDEASDRIRKARLQGDARTLARVIFRSGLRKDFAFDAPGPNFTVVVKDLDINILNPYQQTSGETGVPFDFDAPPVGTGGEEETGIYVCTNEFLLADSALLKILRTLNRLTRCKIDVCSRNTNLKGIVNGNITVSDSLNEIERRVERSRIVVGSGYAILYALKHRRPFVVVGERGYGGIPTENNISLFFREFFQGSIGGRFDGPLPENLVHEDITRLLDSPPDIAPLREKAVAEAMAVGDDLAAMLKRATALKAQEEPDASTLRFNMDYTIIGGNGLFWLLNRFTRFIVEQLDQPRLDVLRRFVGQSEPPQAYSFNESEMSIIKDFIRTQVLIPTPTGQKHEAC